MRVLVIAGAMGAAVAATVALLHPWSSRGKTEAKVALREADPEPLPPPAMVPVSPRESEPAPAAAPRNHAAALHSPAPEDPTRPPPPEATRANMRARLAASQPSNERWTTEAAAAFRRFAAEAPAAAEGVRLSDAECFHDGCIVTARYDDHARYEAMNAAFPQSDAFQKWPGAKYRSPPAAMPGGGEEADWILFNPTMNQ